MIYRLVFAYDLTFSYWMLRDRSRSRSPRRDRDHESDRGFRGAGGGGRSAQPGGALRKPKWDLGKLIKFEKNFYVQHPVVANRSRVSKHTIKMHIFVRM